MHRRGPARLLAVVVVAMLGGACAAAIDPDAIADAETATRVKTALVNDAVVGTRAVEVRVVRGVASLFGRVASQDEHDRVVRIARGVAGVLDVDATRLQVGAIAVEPAVANEVVTGDPAAELRALERRPGLVALGAAVSTSRPSSGTLEPDWAVGPLMRLGRGSGLGVAVGFSWYTARIAPDTGTHVRVRPLMAGLGYTLQRGALAVSTSLVGGWAINSLHVPDHGATPAAVPVDVDSGFAWRPGVSVWRDLSERTALNVSLSYLLTGLDVTYLEAGRLDTRSVSGNTAIVQVGLAYTLF